MNESIGEKSIDSQEQASKDQQERALGAKILAQNGVEVRYEPNVKRSFDRALRRGEKLPGKNNERRNYSYLSRIENIINKYGNRAEKKLWSLSLERLIIAPEDITEGYWRTQEQILRDNGQGHTLSDHEKQILTEDIQKTQRESLKSWSDYLGSEESPYPMWFKVYAWDGMSKMGVFDKEKQQFTKRDKHTVAPYPKLNPAVLAKVYGVITNYYNQSKTDNPERDTELDALIKPGNFNKLYSKILLREKAIPKTPERTEDIHGQWVEYLPGDEEKLATAAEGTPWCVADPGMGRNYLEHGGSTEYGDYDERNPNSRAKFILFHLQDPETNTLSNSACASIRLDTSGNVAEISGLNEGQALEDSLVPIVEKKVRSLPGGYRFLEAFADKKQLIALDRKMQNNEDLTKEEIEFLYEIKRRIKSLDTYQEDDPRIEELKKQYGFEYALSVGVNANQIADRIPFVNIIDHFDSLINHGADINRLIDHLPSYDILENLDALIDRGIDIDCLVRHIQDDVLANNIGFLISRGATIDIEPLLYRMDSHGIIENLDTLISHGININQLVQTMTPYVIIENLDTLIDHGARININKIVSVMSRKDPYYIYSYLDSLLAHGANIDVEQLKRQLQK